jgi:hypothetical protein
MSGERAKKILEDLLNQLDGIDPDDMTTFELNILHRCAENPPKKHRGCEEECINNR